jgi:hypothetical protein
MSSDGFSTQPAEQDGLERLAELASELVELEKAVEAQKEQLAAAERRAKVMSTKTIPELVVELGIPIPAEGLKIPTRHGFSIVVKEEVHGDCSKANMPALIKWLDANGEAGMVKRELSLAFNRDQSEKALELEKKLRPEYPMVESKETVHKGTLKAWVRRRLEAGENLPDVVTFEITRKAKVV